MMTLRRAALLTAVMTGWIVFMFPLPAKTSATTWIDPILRQTLEEKKGQTQYGGKADFDRYLAELQVVQEALAAGNTVTVQREMNRLIRMLAAKDGNIPDSTAVSLLLSIDQVTPSAYLDHWSQTRLHLLRTELAGEGPRELPLDEFEGKQLHPSNTDTGATPWSKFWSLDPRISPWAGTVLLTGAGAMILLILSLKAHRP